MKLILTRHGETEENKQGILQGQQQGKLTNLGIEQAKKLAFELKKEKVDAIYSSDLVRASDTAKEIAKFHPNAELFFVKELREKDQGSFTGKKLAEVDWKNKPKDMESKESMRERAKQILEKAYHRYPSGTVIFVGHGSINKRVLEKIFEEAGKNMADIPEFDNASISIIEIGEEKNHAFTLLNSIRHLEDNNEQR